MKNVKRNLFGWITILSLVLALMPPGAVMADDDGADDGWEDFAPAEVDDSDWEEPVSAPVENADDDDSDDAVEGLGDVEDDTVDIDGAVDGDGDSDDGVEDLDDVEDDTDDIEDDDIDRPIADEAIIQLNPGVDAYDFASHYEMTVLNIVSGPNIVLLNLNPNENDADEVQELMTDSDVMWAELNFTSQAPEGLPRYFFTSMEGGPQIVDAPALPKGLEFSPDIACATGSSVVVAVLDTGVDTEHPALRANILPNGVNMADLTYDINDIGNKADDDNDGQIDEMVGHGTHVSGTILQIAPGASIFPVKVLNSDGVGDTFNVMAGMYYALEQDADIINLSIGTTYDSRAIREAVITAEARGVVVVAAAGNGNQSQSLEYPASIESVISVASTTAGGDKAPYSNFNASIDISAPGDNVASPYPGGLYTTASGTSMSTPLVTGSAALILEQIPDATPQDVRDRLEANAGPLSLTDPAIEGMLGAGEINLDDTLMCSEYPAT